MDKFSAIETLEGRTVLVTGATGFLGKVFLAYLLDRQPRIGRVFVLVRGKGGQSAEERFFSLLSSHPVLAPLREAHGDGLEAYLRAKVSVVDGDVRLEGCGLSEPDRSALTGIELVVHLAGLVALNPALDESLAANARGALNAGLLARGLGAKLLHVSTAYVAGPGPGRVEEAGPARPPAGRHAAQALSDCEAAVREIREAGLPNSPSEGRHPGAKRPESPLGHGGAPPRQAGLPNSPSEGRHGGAPPRQDAAFAGGAKGTRRKRLIEERLLAEGRRLAAEWGRPNVYCFTKALGEALLAEVDGLDCSIVRPSIVESSLRFPFPGWNEGMTTSAPIIYAMLRGHSVWPIRASSPLDVIPVDHVAAALVACAGALLTGRHEPVYHVGTSEANPFRLGLCVSLIHRFRRLHYREFAGGSTLLHWLRTRPRVLTVPLPVYSALSAPALRRLLRLAAGAVERAGLRAPKAWTRLERELGQIDHIVSTFRPFIHDRHYVFAAGRLRALLASLSPADAERLACDPERIDWREYWPQVHIEGLRRWVFPGFEAAPKAGRKRSPAVLERQVRRGLLAFQRFLYGRVFSVRVRYARRVPAGRLLVAANHSSHLDMGLIKHALGPAGRELAPLAAKDYFFRPGWRRWFFSRYTNLVPIDRRSGLKDAVDRTARALASSSVLIFPEGTRSRTGAIAPFKRSLGYLALKTGADLLPVYVDGGYRALPRGRVVPRARRLHAVIGKPIPAEEVRRLCEGVPLKEACRLVTQRVESEVRELERREGSRRRSRALVTGASSGIGRALAVGLASRGHDVAAVGRDAAALEALADECRRRFEAQVTPVLLDLSVPGSAADLAARLSAEAPFDVIVHAAGVGLHGPAADADPRAEAALLQTNALAGLELARGALPAMLERGEGRFLFVSSVYAFCGVPYQAAYAASKAFLWSLARSLAAELEGSGVTVTTLAPGITRTEFRRRAGMPDSGGHRGMSAERVAEAGLDGLFAGRALVVPGWRNQAFVWLARAFPSAAALVLGRVNRSRGLAPERPAQASSRPG